jgi:parallel beta-helix repeat protein
LLAALSGCSSGSDGGGTTGGPRTIEVGQGGSADYASIQAAVDAAPVGSTILVRPGTYAEQVNVSKRLTIRGSGPGTVVEFPAGGLADSAVLRIHDTGGVRVEDLTVRGTGQDADGVRVRDATAIILESIVATSNSQDGVDIRRSSGVELISVVAESNALDGIQVDLGAANVTITASVATSNGSDGIKVRNCSDVRVEGSSSTLNGDDGILVRDASGVELIGNAVTDNTGWGISVHNSPDTIMDGNSVTNNGSGNVKCEPVPCPP